MIADLRDALVAFLALCCLASAVAGVVLWHVGAWLVGHVTGHVTLGMR